MQDGEKEMQLCGHKSLEKYLSSTNKITVQLQVDSTWEFRGFFLQVLAWEPSIFRFILKIFLKNINKFRHKIKNESFDFYN